MLRDEADITIRSGNGGNGKVSFLREKFMPEGGPDGGDGGRGGDVVLVASQHLNTLNQFIRKRRWRAEDGASGGGKNCTGRDGEDLEVPVPCGTIVRRIDTGEILADLTAHDQRAVLAAGGKGGKGNFRFKSSINQVPRQSTPGAQGAQLELKLELKLIADVGLLGFPNAGKSTLLSRLSMARPKIGPYPFTTLEPQLGVLARGDRTVVIADIPGLIEGAAEGRGLGHQFLRHVERCGLLVHLVDGSEGEAEELVARVRVLNAELERFSPLLASKPQLLVLNKADTRDLSALTGEVAALAGVPCLAISAVSGAGIDALAVRLTELVPEPVTVTSK